MASPPPAPPPLTAEERIDAATAIVCDWDAPPALRRQRLRELLRAAERAAAERMLERIAAGLDRGVVMARQAGQFDRAAVIADSAAWVRALPLG